METFPWLFPEPASTSRACTSAGSTTTPQYNTPVTSHWASWVCVWVHEIHFLIWEQNTVRPFSPSASPTVFVPQQWVVLERENQLKCHAEGFYPPPVSFSWTRNGKEIQPPYTTAGHPAPDGYYTAVGNLTLYPSRDDQNVTFGCRVWHNGIEQELNFTLRITCEWHTSITGRHFSQSS